MVTTLFIGTIGFLATPHSPSQNLAYLFILLNCCRCLRWYGVYGGPCQQPSYLVLLRRGAMGPINSSGNMGAGRSLHAWIHQWSHIGSFAYGYYVMGGLYVPCWSINLTLPKSMEHKEGLK